MTGEEPNKEQYESVDLVESYSPRKELLKPEEVVLDAMRPAFGDMSMLDIGVGGGRTTVHFAPLVRVYVGIDYSNAMIDACRRRFSSVTKPPRFYVCDVRSMGMFEDAAFDFVLFSYNGIDIVPHDDRPKALTEIRRVCRRGGYFLFSTHNIRSIDNLLRFRFSVHPKSLKREVLRYIRIRLLNSPLRTLKNETYAVFRDGADSFRTTIHYIRPEDQVRQLEEVGFRNVRVFDLKGREFDPALNAREDKWIHCLCQA